MLDMFPNGKNSFSCESKVSGFKPKTVDTEQLFTENQFESKQKIPSSQFESGANSLPQSAFPACFLSGVSCVP